MILWGEGWGSEFSAAGSRSGLSVASVVEAAGGVDEVEESSESAGRL